MKILILKPSSLGDVVQALPVLRLLKRHLPHSEIYWWIDSGLAPLIEDDPDLAGVIRFERRAWAAPRNWLQPWRTIQWMRLQSFDWVIDLQCLMRSGAFAWLANGALTVGLDEPREGARGFYDRIARRPSFLTHAVDWYLGILPLVGLPVRHGCISAAPLSGPLSPARSPRGGEGEDLGQSRAWSFPLSLAGGEGRGEGGGCWGYRVAGVPGRQDFQWLPPRPAVAVALRQKWPVGTGSWIVLQPGARWLNKRWPIESFAELLRRLASARNDLRFAILGGRLDCPLGERLARVAPERCLDLTGRTSLPEMVEWIRLCRLMVTNDTGPMHVAAALGKPVVALLGPTEPRRTGPYGQLANVLQLDLPCVPCLKSRCACPRPNECLRALSVETVLAAVEKRLTET